MNHSYHFAGRGVLTLAGIILSAAITRADDGALAARLDALEQRIDVLAKENQGLRDQLAAQEKKSAAPAVGIAGKEPKLAIGGYLHLQAETGNAPDSRFAGIDDRFLVRRARFTVKGSLTKEFSFKLESELGNGSISGKSGYSAQLTDVYLDWTKYAIAQVRLGQFKTPFGYEQLMADTKIPFVERSEANDKLTVSRQIGLGVSGDLVTGRLGYALGMFNGNGTNKGTNDNGDFLWAGRVNGTVIKRDGIAWDAAAGVFSSQDTGSFTGRHEGWEVDTQVVWRALAVQAEWLRNTYDATTGADHDAEGWYVMGEYMLDPHWQLKARYESYDPNTAAAGDDENTITLGVNWLIVGNDLKLSFDYLHGDANFAGSGDRLLGRLQLVF